MTRCLIVKGVHPAERSTGQCVSVCLFFCLCVPSCVLPCRLESWIGLWLGEHLIMRSEGICCLLLCFPLNDKGPGINLMVLYF